MVIVLVLVYMVTPFIICFDVQAEQMSLIGALQHTASDCVDVAVHCILHWAFTCTWMELLQ